MRDIDLISDEELLRRMSRDDRESFTLLYKRHWEMLFVATIRVIAQKEDAEDVIQEVFVSLWNRRKELKLTGPVGAYLQASVKYKAISYIEKNITRRRYLETLEKAVDAGPQASPEVLLQAKEIQSRIRTVIENMPPKMREVYRLSRQEHLTHKEIAARLAITEETVKKHIQNALQLLRTAMGRTAVSLPALLYYLLSERL